MPFEVYMRQGANPKGTAMVTERRQAIAALWMTGSTSSEIAEALGITDATVKREAFRMRQSGWHLPYRYRRRG